MTTHKARFGNMLKHSAVAMAIVAISGISPSAEAQRVPEGEQFLDAIADCQRKASKDDRLSCYDTVANQIAEARNKNEISLLSRQEVDEQRRTVFGLTVDDGRLFQKGGKKLPLIASIDTTVTQIAIAGRGVFRVTLADGSVWRTTESAAREPVVGDSVHIRRGALGSFLASFAGARSVRIQRLR